jgi:hypothetical protein
MNFGQRRGALQEPEEVRSGVAGQQRPIPTGPDGRHVPGLDARRLVADPENTSMNANKVAARHPSLDLRRAKAGIQQLAPSDHAMAP